MTPLDPIVARALDDIANALQSAVLLTEHLDRIASAAGRDRLAIAVALRRATDALTRLNQDGRAR